METNEKKSTQDTNTVDKYAVIDTLTAFRQLDNIRKQKSLSVVEISVKLNIKKSAYYRYCSEYTSQRASQPSMSLIRKYAALFDYDVNMYLSKKVC